jgi:hypothetical protein
MKNDLPPEFILSGSEEVMLFKVTGSKSGEVWKLYPMEKGVSLDDLGKIVYGSVPKLYRQETPKDGPPAQLTEEEIYSAGAIIFDHEPVVIRFTIKNGKALPEPQ